MANNFSLIFSDHSYIGVLDGKAVGTRDLDKVAALRLYFKDCMEKCDAYIAVVEKERKDGE